MAGLGGVLQSGIDRGRRRARLCIVLLVLVIGSWGFWSSATCSEERAGMKTLLVWARLSARLRACDCAAADFFVEKFSKSFRILLGEFHQGISLILRQVGHQFTQFTLSSPRHSVAALYLRNDTNDPDANANDQYRSKQHIHDILPGTESQHSANWRTAVYHPMKSVFGLICRLRVCGSAVHPQPRH